MEELKRQKTKINEGEILDVMIKRKFKQEGDVEKAL